LKHLTGTKRLAASVTVPATLALSKSLIKSMPTVSIRQVHTFSKPLPPLITFSCLGLMSVTNAFAEAPPPTQGFFIQPNCTFHKWREQHKGQPPILPGHIIPVLSTMQGHPKSPRLWEKHADAILCNLSLQPKVHEPCLYLGTIPGKQIVLNDNLLILQLLLPTGARQTYYLIC
jgi:hypothetical protein